MGHDDLHEIFERLDALERLVRSRSGERGGWEEDRRGGRDRHVHERDERGRGRSGDEFMQRRDDSGGEKRVVDLVVRLVCEQVREIVQDIVSTELDRRFGRPGGETRAGNPPPYSGSSGPEQR